MHDLTTTEQIIQAAVIGLQSQYGTDTIEVTGDSEYQFAIDTIEGKRHDGYHEKIKRQDWYEAVD